MWWAAAGEGNELQNTFKIYSNDFNDYFSQHVHFLWLADVVKMMWFGYSSKYGVILAIFLCIILRKCLL